jgi:Hint domain
MPSYTWSSAVSGNWSTATNWSPNGVPGAIGGDTVTIGVTGADYTITYDETTEAINNLAISSANATLAFSTNDVLTVYNSTTLQAGTIDLENGGDILNIGTLSAGGLSTSAGSIINIGAGSLVNFYSATLDGLVDITGTTSFGTNSAAITLSGIIEASGGTGTVSFASLTGTGTLEAAGATLLVTSSLANSPADLVVSDSTASVFETTGILYYGSSVQISFLGTHGEFEYDNSTNDTHVTFNISGLNAGPSTTTPTNFIDLAGEVLTINGGGTGTTTTGSVTLSNGDTLALSGITGLGSAGWAANAVSDGSGGTEVLLSSVCYAAGTRILTVQGDKLIEDIAKDDMVITLVADKHVPQPVKWVGQRRINIAAHPRPETVAPIRIQHHAIAGNMPHRDLLLSPDHAIFIDGKLICARQLVNGTTIRQETGLASVEYFHVELDAHAILLADGLPAESYLNTGNRHFFTNSHEPVLLHPDLAGESDFPTRGASSCAPFVWDEPSVQPVWQRLAERAATLGQPVQTPATALDPNLCVVANGRTIRPLTAAHERFIFVLPTDATEVRLVSHAALPTDAKPWLEDRRRLGVYVKRVVQRRDRDVWEVPLDHPTLSRGWWAVEHAGAALRRWTNGDAVVSLPASGGPTMLEVHLACASLAYPIERLAQVA